MALHDYICSGCGSRLTDIYRQISVKASETAPFCTVCNLPMVWIPQVGRMDAREPFQRSTVYVRQPDGSEKQVEIQSLHQMRQIERESEQRARDGEGQQMVWRDYSQDKSQFDQHSFANDPAQRPEKTGKVRVTPVSEDVAESASYGPAVSDANTSALGE